MSVSPALTRMPPGFSRPSRLLGDPQRGGVWFVAISSASADLFFLNAATKVLTRYGLGDPSADPSLLFDLNQGLASDGAGNVWIGTGEELLEVDPATGRVSRWPAPVLPDLTQAEAPRPPELRGSHEINAIAVDAGGDVAIAMTAASAIAIFNPNKQATSIVPLPAGAAADALSYLSDGTLLLALSDLTGAGDNAVIAVTGQQVHAQQLPPVDPQTLTGGGGEAVIASISGLTTLSPGSAPVVVSPMPQDAVGGAAMALLGDHRIALPGRRGPIILDPRTGTATELVLPVVGNCVPALPPPPPGQTEAPAPSSMVCQPGTRDVAVDGQGNLWVVPDLSNAIAELPAGSF